MVFLFALINTLFFTFDFFVNRHITSPTFCLLWGLFIWYLIIFLRKESINFSKQSVILFVLSAIIYTWSLYQGDSSYSLILFVVGSFIFFRDNIEEKLKLKTICLVVCVCALIECAIAWFQLVSVSHADFRQLIMSGTFDNPFGLGLFLTFSLPFNLYLIGKGGKSNFYLRFNISIIIITILFSGSRTGLISSIIIVLYHLVKTKLLPTDLLKRHLGKFVFASFCIGAILYIIKKDSANGRLVIWSSTIEMIQDSPLFGHGPSSFQKKYMLYQAQSMQTSCDEDQKYLADNITHPFNEYLKIGVEFGLIVLVLFIGGSIVYVRKILNHHHKGQTIYIELLISLGICSFFSYPLYYPISWIIIGYIIANTLERKIYTIHINRLISYSIFGLFFVKLYYDTYYEYRWKILYQQILIGKSNNYTSDYNDLYFAMNNNPYFCYNYCAYLNSQKKYTESMSIINNSNINQDYDLQLLMADNCMHLNQFNLAEQYYIKASNMCPNRFIPLYKLYKLYEIRGQTAQAYCVGSNIINKPVKVPSQKIDWIKTQLKRKIGTEKNR